MYVYINIDTQTHICVGTHIYLCICGKREKGSKGREEGNGRLYIKMFPSGK